MSTNGIESSEWTPSSWRSKPAKQEVVYDNEQSLEQVKTKLNSLPPLVTPFEIQKLKNELRECALGNAFLLQGGDCAELFDYCNQNMIEAKVKLLLQMSLVLIYGARKKVVRVARMAGQYAKPRSSPMEKVNGIEMPSFRGDILNSYEPDPKARKPDPARLLEAYYHSAATLNYIRAAIDSGFADLHAPLNWSLGHVVDKSVRNDYQRMVSRIIDTLDMMRTIGLDSGGALETVSIFTSHEGLLLEYEQSLTRQLRQPKNAPQPYITDGAGATNGASNPSNTRTLPHSSTTITHPSSAPTSSSSSLPFYNTSAHFIWIGDRTRQLTHAHVEYFRGITNPIGVKLGPSMPPSDIVPLLDILNPNYEIGKIVLITRYGAAKIADHLPAHIRAVQNSHHNGTVVWQCDPMHGNGRNATVTAKRENTNINENNNSTSQPDGKGAEAHGVVETETETVTFKTRRFSDILSELQQCLAIHKALNSYLGGMHLELTGEDVTECVGGGQELTEEDLNLRYTTFCDPRLNEKQALELAFLVAGFYRDGAA